MIRAQKIYKSFGSLQVLKGIDLEAGNSEVLSIVGASGAGKSSLLHILGTLSQPDSGTLLIDGIDVFKLNSDNLADFRNKKIGFVFQFHHLLPEFTALENVLLPTWIESGTADHRKETRAKELLALVGLQDRMKNMANNLSGGQQQRVSIARALINEPNLVLADEPTGNLDSDSTEQVYELLRTINRDLGMSFLIVTHDRHIAEKSDRVIEMKDGRIVNDYRTNEKLPQELWQCLAPHNCKLMESR